MKNGFDISIRVAKFLVGKVTDKKLAREIAQAIEIIEKEMTETRRASERALAEAYKRSSLK